MKRAIIRLGLIGALSIIGYFLSGCDKSLFKNDLEVIKARGELIVVMRNNSVCYYEGPYGPTGFEYDIAKSFADYLGVRLTPLIIEDEAEMIETLLSGKADMIAAGIPFGNRSARFLSLGPGYLDVSQQIVGRRGSKTPMSLNELSEASLWMTGSSARMEALKALKKKNADISWQTLSDFSSEELLQMVWNQSLPYTIVESHTLAMNRRYFPELTVYFTLGHPQKLAWAIHPQNRSLQREAMRWFTKSDTQSAIQGFTEYYFSHLENFDYVDLTRYRRRIQERLPKYKNYFEEAARQFGFDWQLVAAQSYQESHWNPRAKSFTGVRGIMMLTQDTAKTMGVKNRLAARDSIFAGTHYLSKLHQMVGDDVPEPDRTLMALASYNLGFGHLQDARALADRLGKPSKTWHGIRSVLPLLQKKKYYSMLPNGYARGNEAVQYVDRIRTYHKILTKAHLRDNSSNMGG